MPHTVAPQIMWPTAPESGAIRREDVISGGQRGSKRTPCRSRRGRAIADFSESYTDQNERDYDAFAAAVKSGRLTARTGL
jgi:hypothetical protein